MIRHSRIAICQRTPIIRIAKRPPAPLTMCTVFIAHEIVHAIWRALGEAVPSRACAGWGKTIHNITSGRQPGSTEPYVMYNWAANAAGGAVEGRDGFNQIGLLIALAVAPSMIWVRSVSSTGRNS